MEERVRMSRWPEATRDLRSLWYGAGREPPFRAARIWARRAEQRRGWGGRVEGKDDRVRQRGHERKGEGS
jgi:hypothetical protein